MSHYIRSLFREYQTTQLIVPYKWIYEMDTIDLSQEDIDSIVYEVVNAKAASAENKNKKAPKPISRKRKYIQN